MSAYWIAEYDEVTDPDKVAAYAALAKPALEGEGGRFLVRGLPEQVRERGEMTRTVVVEFETIEAALAAWDSPAYQEALAALDGGASRDLRIVPGA